MIYSIHKEYAHVMDNILLWKKKKVNRRFDKKFLQCGFAILFYNFCNFCNFYHPNIVTCNGYGDNGFIRV